MTRLPLTYVPTLDSLHVYLNGIEQYEPTDWTYGSPTNNVITVNSTMESRSGDLLEVRYAHKYETGTYPLIVPVVEIAFVQSGATHPSMDLTGTGFGAGDLIIGAIHTQGSAITPTPAVTTLYNPSGTSGGAFLDLALVWSYTATGGETAISFNTGTNSFSRTAAGLAIFRGASVGEMSASVRGAAASTVAPTLTDFEAGDIALLIGISSHGVVSGSGTFPTTAGYTKLFDVDGAGGKHSVFSTYWSCTVAGSNPTQTATFSGSVNGWDVRTLRLVPA